MFIKLFYKKEQNWALITSGGQNSNFHKTLNITIEQQSVVIKMGIFEVIETIRKDGLRVEGNNGSYRLTHDLLEKGFTELIPGYTACNDIRNKKLIEEEEQMKNGFLGNLYASVPVILSSTMAKLDENSPEYAFVKNTAMEFIRDGMPIRIGDYSGIVDPHWVRHQERQKNGGKLPEDKVIKYMSGERVLV